MNQAPPHTEECVEVLKEALDLFRPPCLCVVLPARLNETRRSEKKGRREREAEEDAEQKEKQKRAFSAGESYAF